MRTVCIGMVLAGALSFASVPAAAWAQTPVALSNPGETSNKVRTLLRFEEAPLMLESMKAAPDSMAAEFDFQFRDRMGPELDRFRTILDEGLRAPERNAEIEAQVRDFAPQDVANIAQAETLISGQREMWQAAERAGRSEAFLRELGPVYDARPDKAELERLADLRVSVTLAEQNARALGVFTHIVRSVLLDGPQSLNRVPDDQWKDGIQQAYATVGKDDAYPKTQMARDVERNRQRILLMGLDAEQVRGLLAFYESAAGRKWSEELSKAYGERLRALTSEVTIAYVEAVKHRDK